MSSALQAIGSKLRRQEDLNDGDFWRYLDTLDALPSEVCSRAVASLCWDLLQILRSAARCLACYAAWHLVTLHPLPCRPRFQLRLLLIQCTYCSRTTMPL